MKEREKKTKEESRSWNDCISEIVEIDKCNSRYIKISLKLDDKIISRDQYHVTSNE